MRGRRISIESVANVQGIGTIERQGKTLVIKPARLGKNDIVSLNLVEATEAQHGEKPKTFYYSKGLFHPNSLNHNSLRLRASPY